MNRNAIQLNDTGVYIFQSPAKVSAQINKELFIVFSAPSLKATGIIVYKSDMTTKDLYAMLDSLYQQFTSELKAKPSQIKVKLFGLGTPNSSTSHGVRTWVETKKMTITAEDTGRNVSRGLVIDCETGLVGVSYAEGVPAGSYADNGFLAPGGAADRETSQEPKQKVLALFNSKVSRQLGRQCLDEYKTFNATVPNKPYDSILQRDVSNFDYSVVLISEDIGAIKPVEMWVKKVFAAYPMTQFIWVGEKFPAALKKVVKKFRSLPPLKPSELGTFKTALRAEIDSLPPRDMIESSVISFPAPKAKKRSKTKGKAKTKVKAKKRKRA